MSGEAWALAAIPVNPQRFFDQFGDVAASPNTQAYMIYGQPASVTAAVVQRQRVLVLLFLALQLCVMLAVCGAAYHPLHSLLSALERRGFLHASDRPTLAKVARVYVLGPIRMRLLGEGGREGRGHMAARQV